MENRLAWRILDYLKDIFMHHRKFTPFQKLMISSIIVGVSMCLFRNFWILALAMTYGIAVYCSVCVTDYIHRSKAHFASDQLLVYFEKFHDFLSRLWNSFLPLDVNESSKDTEARDGDNAVVETENEFFDAIDQTPKLTGLSTTPVEVGDQVLQEVEIIQRYIRRDFIQSWYGLFGSDERVMAEADTILHCMTDSIKARLKTVDTIEMSQHILQMFRSHVHSVHQAQLMYKVQKRRRKSATRLKSISDDSKSAAKSSLVVYKSVEECFCAKVELHTALRTEESEQSYLKSVVEVLLLHLLPTGLHESKAVVCALSEILMCNVLQNVMSLLSGTTFLHEKIILITSDEQPCVCVENKPIIVVTETDCSHDNVQSILVNKHSGSCGTKKDPTSNNENNIKQSTDEVKPVTKSSADKLDINNDTNVHEVQWKEDLELHPVSKGMCNECNRLCSKDKDKISPRPHSCSLGTKPIFFDVTLDPDRLSLSSQNSMSSREGSPIFHYPVPESAVVNSAKSNIESFEHCVAGKMNPSPINGDASDSAINTHDQVVEEPLKDDKDHQKKPAINQEEEVKPNSNIFDRFTGNFQFPKTLSSMLPKRSSSAIETMEIIPANKLEIKSSRSSCEIRKEQLTPTTPGEASVPWPEDGPSVFQDVRISGTETAKEPGSTSQYTLYIVEYEALYHSEEGELVHKTGTVRRRFREFENLQSRLENNPEYKKSLKDVKGPKKMLPALPFGNMGQQTVDSRKKLLESFLTSLIKHSDICNGEEMKQFLGYSGDGHIAFVKTKTEATVARIDQKLVKTMSGVFDSIFEGLPSLPRQIPKIIPSFDSAEDKKEAVQEKGLEDSDVIDLHFIFQSDMVHSEKMDRFTDIMSRDVPLDERPISPNNTTLGTSILGWQEQQKPISPTTSSHMISKTGHMTTPGSHMISGPQLMSSSPTCTTSSGGLLSPFPKQTDRRLSDDGTPPVGQLRRGSQGLIDTASEEGIQAKRTSGIAGLTDHSRDDTDCPLTGALLDVLTELLHGQDSWVCRDNVITVTKVLMGRALTRYLEGRINHLTSTEMTRLYLNILLDTVWPGGALSQEPRPTYTDQQKELMRKQAARCLGDFLPDVLRVILGKEDFDSLIDEAMETIKFEKLNRHFWFSVLDVVLERLIPEITSPELQRKLSASTERL